MRAQNERFSSNADVRDKEPMASTMSKTVLVTGGARGIGKAIVRAFAAEGWRIILHYHTSCEQAGIISEELCRQGVTHMTHKADISKSGEVNLMVENINKRFGAVDVLINNAGIAKSGLITECSEAEYDSIFGVNMKGAYLMSRAVLPAMISAHSGNIINISSMWGVSGASMEVIYSASKAALIGFTKALSKEVAPSGIRVNCIAPGVIDTDMTNWLTKEDREELESKTPLKKIGTPKDVAQAALYLASSEASYITGQIISVDGGFII